MQLETYNLITVTARRWDHHNWSSAADGYKLFRTDRQGQRGRGVALHVKRWIDYTELSLKNSDEQVESL